MRSGQSCKTLLSHRTPLKLELVERHNGATAGLKRLHSLRPHQPAERVGFARLWREDDGSRCCGSVSLNAQDLTSWALFICDLETSAELPSAASGLKSAVLEQGGVYNLLEDLVRERGKRGPKA